MRILLVSLIVSGIVFSSAALATEPVSIDSLLSEMVDRDSVAKFPANEFRLKQHSSYNRASKNPQDTEGWFSNHDFNSKDSDRNFIRIEENGGQKEWVLMDHEGPGALVRVWMPFRNAKNPKTDTRIRVYLDGESEPTLEGNMLGLFNGSEVFPYPFAHQSLRSAVSFFPIPYAKRCKITTTERPFFFQFTFREYNAKTPVETFTMSDYEAAKPLLDKVGESLLNPTPTLSRSSNDTPTPQTLNATLAAGEEKSIDLPAGTAAVRALSVKLGTYEPSSVTRTVVLKMEFDGKETVWCPLGDFFGTGLGLHPFQGWYRTVADDGTMSCRWVMPYQKSAKVSLLNLSDAPIDFEMNATVDDFHWDDRTMYFHAAWRGQYPVPTRPFCDWNYVTLNGRGVYVGDTLTVMNPVEKWWGEGDEKIFVDGEDFPSIFGTGTEDYYAYSWGGISTDFYEHPFHAQPRSHVYDKHHRKTSSERNTLGYSTETRTRALDTMPFGSSLQLDMEIWSWNDCEMGYGVGAYWYADADTQSNRTPDPEEALNVPPLPKIQMDSAPQASVDPSLFENAIELEDGDIVSKPSRVELVTQSLTAYRGRWSGNTHVLMRNTRQGDAIEWTFAAPGPMPMDLSMHATRSHDFAEVKFSVNGIPVGETVDLYSPKPTPSGSIPLGRFSPDNGRYTVGMEIVGKNDASSRYRVGLDCLSMSSPDEPQSTSVAK
ncbi:MAG: glycoside hydrolase family 172 protein [Rhodopirellula sp. JB044]|uniref:glycoside hydrolase family 172 protein n=1 Tax=Rhodopirellula sp. JB044 TaxID=3342844 RepID=UPI003709E8A7